MYSDWFCSIDDMGNGRAWYADMTMTAFSIPIKWAEKIVKLFKENRIKDAMNHIDMCQKRR